jgi:beta-N-acetylhexosaminidase
MSHLMNVPLEIKIGQMIMAGIAGKAADDDARYVVDELKIGNVILMGRNVESPQQVLALTQGLQSLAATALGIPLLIATDQEGGRVQRLNQSAGFLPMPSPAAVGTSSQPETIRRFAYAVGQELLAVGIHVAFAPVLDVDDNPDNPVVARLRRSFGSTPEQVSRAAIPFIAGLHDAGVLSGGKHFPGHGSTSKDSHVDLPTVTKDRAALAATELVPFRDAIAAGIDMVLTAHVTYPALDPSDASATLSNPILTGLLRRDLGFTGLIVTDGLEMDGITRDCTIGEAAVRAVEAGVDIVLCVRQLPTTSRGREVIAEIRTALAEAVATGRLAQARIDESFQRIVELKTRHSVGSASGDTLDLVGGFEHRQVLAELLSTVSAEAIEADADRPSLSDRLTDIALDVRAAIHGLGDRVSPSRGPLD